MWNSNKVSERTVSITPHDPHDSWDGPPLHLVGEGHGSYQVTEQLVYVGPGKGNYNLEDQQQQDTEKDACINSPQAVARGEGFFKSGVVCRTVYKSGVAIIVMLLLTGIVCLAISFTGIDPFYGHEHSKGLRHDDAQDIPTQGQTSALRMKVVGTGDSIVSGKSEDFETKKPTSICKDFVRLAELSKKSGASDQVKMQLEACCKQEPPLGCNLKS